VRKRDAERRSNVDERLRDILHDTGYVFRSEVAIQQCRDERLIGLFGIVG
jgi:hypothetical protein